MFYKELEDHIEVLRLKMQDKANTLGLGHPEVYKISCELDNLHNLWEKERMKRKNQRDLYCLNHYKIVV